MQFLADPIKIKLTQEHCLWVAAAGPLQEGAEHIVLLPKQSQVLAETSCTLAGQKGLFQSSPTMNAAFVHHKHLSHAPRPIYSQPIR